MIYPSNFEQKIGISRIRELVAKHCLSSMGERLSQEFSFASQYELVEGLLSQTAEMVHICRFEDDFPIDNYIDLTPGLKKARVEGMHLEVQEVFDLRRSLETVRALMNFFRSREESSYPALRKLLQGVKVYPAVIDRINMILTSNGRIKDNASKELSGIRQSMRDAQDRVGKRLQSVMREAMSKGWVEKDAQITIRDGRMVIPVNANDKRKLKGLIHDESSTGKTCFIEPAEVVEVNNEIKELAYAEQREIIHILTLFTDFLRPYVEDLAASYSFMGTIDFIRAKALFAIDINALKPVIEKFPHVNWQQAYHPLLFLNHRREGKPVVPLDIELKAGRRILVISGPNAGGKSVCLQTAGLLQYMLQCGLLVPVKEGSEFGLFSNVFIDIGDEQSIENDLSTYSSHLVNMKNFLRHAGEDTLILIDEMGAGTEPSLGGAIAEAILDRLNRSGCFGVVTTHYTNLKQFATHTDGLVNGAMLFDTGRMEPLFKLEMGKPGSSFAFEISHRIGLPDEILEQAREKVGEGQVKWDKYLKDISRDKYYWERKRESIRVAGKRAGETADELEEELEKLKNQKKEIIRQAKAEAEQILAQANKLIENTIREIRETQADKEKSKEVRKQVEQFREELHSAKENRDEDLALQHKIQKGRKLLSASGEKTEKKKTSVLVAEVMAIKVGDKVRLVNQDITGEVMEVTDKSLLVAFGHMITTVQEKQLEKISEGEYKKQQKSHSGTVAGYSLEKKMKFRAEIDLRGKRADEALEEVAHFIDDAMMLSVPEVRILHGKGNGILRQLVRDYLRSIDLVKSCADDDPDRGGTGITIVKFGY